MKLYLVQHGLALPEEKDPKRPLSLEGRNETEKMANFLKLKNIHIACLWHSAKTRALETAEIILKAISCPQIRQRNDLNPLDPVEKLPQQILSLDKDLMIVGHLPHLEKLASLLLAGSESSEIISFKNSGVVCLEYSERWRLSWMIISDII